MTLRIEIEKEKDGRWIAEVVDIPGLNGPAVYGETPDEAFNKAAAAAREVIADRVAHNELSPEVMPLTFVAA